MTIRKGVAWGEIGPPPPDLGFVTDDATLHDWVVRHRTRAQPITPVGIRGGDLARSAGGGDPGRFDGQVLAAPFDLVRVEAADGAVTWSASHVVARRSWLRGEVLFAMTAQYWHGYDVAPRSHPNDGKVDIVRVAAEMPPRVRLAARRRAHTGTHVPHPQLAFAQTAATVIDFARPLVVWVDDRRWTTTSCLTLTVEPDAYTGYA